VTEARATLHKDLTTTHVDPSRAIDSGRFLAGHAVALG
jgi:hypothetical protein